MRDLSGLDAMSLEDLRALKLLVSAARVALAAIEPNPERNVCTASIEKDDGVWLLTIDMPANEGGA